MGGKITKNEKILLLAAMLFLCVLLGFFLRDRQLTDSGDTVVETEFAAASSAVVPAEAERIDLNTATAEQLTELPGIGEELAGRIVAYREDNGAFARGEDIQNVEGIGPGKYEAIQDYITVTAGEEEP